MGPILAWSQLLLSVHLRSLVVNGIAYELHMLHYLYGSLVEDTIKNMVEHPSNPQCTYSGSVIICSRLKTKPPNLCDDDS
jgi:hypothetical protein